MINDCDMYISHMDVFPTVMEYLGLEISPEWDLDGRSRLEWNPDEKERCELSHAKSVITLSGGYIFNAKDADIHYNE